MENLLTFKEIKLSLTFFRCFGIVYLKVLCLYKRKFITYYVVQRDFLNLALIESLGNCYPCYEFADFMFQKKKYIFFMYLLLPLLYQRPQAYAVFNIPAIGVNERTLMMDGVFKRNQETRG